MKLLLSIAVLFMFFDLARAEDGGFAFRPSYQIFRSKNYEGNLLGLQIEKSITTKFAVLLGQHRFSRTFGDGTKIEESAFDLGFVYEFDSPFYVEFGGSYASQAQILPVSYAYVTPHWVLGNSDLSLGMGFSRYAKVDAGTIHPNYLYDFNSEWRAELGAYIVRTENTITSGHGDVTYKPFENHSFRLDASSGRSLEDAGLEAQFTSFSFEYGYRRPHWSVYLSATDYRSDIRHEMAYGIRMEFR